MDIGKTDSYLTRIDVLVPSVPLPSTKQYCQSLLSSVCAALCTVATVATPAQAADLTYLQGLLSPAPSGAWVQANLNTFSSAWPTGADAVNIDSYSGPNKVVTAWSSFAWDTKRADLIIFGGGHANYAGNEVYLWEGATGLWSRGSLPTQLNASGLIADNSAPQSSHTYDNNQYLSINDRFLDFGGAAYPQGGNEYAIVNGVPTRTGPWLWNPNLANPNLVGGATGTGYDPARQGGYMWTDRQANWTGTEPGSYINGTAAYRTEGGKDVVYITGDTYQSGWPELYKYTLGNVQTGEPDKWEVVGMNSGQGTAFNGAGAIDSQNGLFVRTSNGTNGYDLIVWYLTGSPTFWSQSIKLQFSDGTAFVMDSNFGIDYDKANGYFYAWNGSDVFAFHAEFGANNQLLSTWTVTKMTASTAAHPQGNFVNGVLGKWHYVDELDSFIALDEYDFSTADAGVWLYKPLATAVPEPSAWQLWLSGLALLMAMMRRLRRIAAGSHEHGLAI